MEPGSPALSLAVLDHRGKGVTATSRRSPKDILTAKQFGIREEIKNPRIIRKNVAGSAFYITKAYLESVGLRATWDVRVVNSPIFGGRFKSGLGSSAASTVAVVKSLFVANNRDLVTDAGTIHKLAQYAYAAYAERAESGFDIATCFSGHSIVYKRFRPDSIVLPASLDSGGILSSLLLSLKNPWREMSVEKVRIPSKYTVLFFNIEGAKTSTLSNVGAVMNWRSGHAREYERLIKAQGTHERLGIQSFLRGDDAELRTHTRRARQVQRTLQALVASEASEFDLIEPLPLTKLIGLGESLPGVVAGRCPGAGGWDGLAFVADKEELKEESCSKIAEGAAKYGLKLTRISLRLV